MHHAITTRKEENWSSQVFAGAKQNEVRYRNLARGDAGRGGLYGDDQAEIINTQKTYGANFNRETEMI